MIYVASSPIFGWFFLVVFLSAIVKSSIDNYKKRKAGDKSAIPFFATLPGIIVSAIFCVLLINFGIPWQLVTVMGAAYCVYVFFAVKNASCKS